MLTHRFVPFIATFIVGVLAALQARINGQLSTVVGNSFEAAVFSFGSGLAVLTVLMVFVPSIRRGVVRVPAAIRSGELAWWQVLGGVLGGFVVAVQAAAVPVIGVALFMVALVAGLSTNSLLVDRAGLGPAGRQPITGRRIVSAIVAVAAVGLVVANRVGGDVPLVAVVFAVVGGSLLAVQQAINGRVARATRSPMSATFLNFMFGTAALVAVFGASWAFAGHDPAPLPNGPWWIYLGGVIGIAYVAIASWVVPMVGVLLFALLSIAGQLCGAVLLDLVAPTSGTVLGWNLFAGVLLAFVAVAIGARRGSATAPMRESTP